MSALRTIIRLSEQSRRRSRLGEASAVAAGAGVGYAGLRIGRAAGAAEKVISTDGAVAARNAREITDAAVKVRRLPGRLIGRLRGIVRFSTREFAEQLTGKLAKDRYIKAKHDEDLDRRDANILRGGLAGALAGGVMKNRVPLARRALIGGIAGAAGVLAVRQATSSSRDVYGERSRGAKKVELLPAATAVGIGALALKKRLNLSRAGTLIHFREKRELNPAVKAGLSAGLSGAALGLLPALKRGTGLRAVLKSVAVGAGAGASVVGGGTVIGSKILGNPKKDEGAPITKRAALGSAIAAAPLGIAGGVLLHKTAAGRKLLAKVARSGKNPHWLSRPALLAKKIGPVGTAAIAGTAATVAAGAHAADEGQQVDTLNSLKKDRRTRGTLFARLDATISFGKVDQPRYAESKRYADPLRAYGSGASLVDANGNAARLSQSQLVGAAFRTGHTVRRTVQRGSNLLRDVSAVATGQQIRGRKPEYEKAWVRNAVLSTGGAGAVLAHAVLRRKLPAYRLKTDAIEKVAKAHVAKARGKLDNALGLSRGRLSQVIEFDYYQPPGWDLRDAKGKSVRVFAPGSQKRQRRTASYHETKEGQRKILTGVAVAGTVGGVVAGAVLSPKLRRAKLLLKRSRPWVDARAIAPSKIVQMPAAG